MNHHSLKHLSDQTLVRGLQSLVARDCQNTALLLAAAVHKSKAQIEQLLAERFPRPDLPTLVSPIATAPANNLLVPEPVKLRATEHAAPAPAPAKLTPLAPQRFAVQFTMGQEAHDDLLYAQALLGHAVPNGDMAEVFARALKTLIARLEQQKFGRDFMETKRETRGKPPLPEHAAEIVPVLRLGMRAEEARDRAACCTDMPEASLEDRVKHALKCAGRRLARRAG